MQKKFFIIILSLILSVMSVPLVLADGPTEEVNREKARISGLSEVENIELVGHLGGNVNKVVISGSYAFVGSGTELTILDVSNPTTPVRVGYYAAFANAIRALAIAGNYAYVGDGSQASQGDE